MYYESRYILEILILGAGKLGTRIAEALSEGDHALTIVDNNSDVISRLNQQLDVMTVNGDGRNIDLLRDLNIHTFDFFISVTENDETNILTASFAKKLGCKSVIARVRDPEHMNQLAFIKETLDIDMTVNPDMAITNEIYKYLVEKYTLSNGIFTSGKFSLLEFNVQKYPVLAGKSMVQVREVLPEMIIVAISRKGKIIIPHGSDVIENDDILYVAGERDEIFKLNKIVQERGKFNNLRKVMIVGGGKTGYYLAGKLADFGASVKLIEKDKARSQYLSTHLSNVMVLYGDGTDIDLLIDENMDDMDAFVTATGFDEENLLLALTAKNHHIKDVISKVSRESYAELIEKMGVDMVLNPLDIAASNILRMVQGRKRVISSVLIQGQAEIMEIVGQKDMAMVGIPIAQLELPEGVLICAIHRNQELIIPTGDTRIKTHDKVVMLSLLSALDDLEKLLKRKNKSLLQ